MHTCCLKCVVSGTPCLFYGQIPVKDQTTLYMTEYKDKG